VTADKFMGQVVSFRYIFEAVNTSWFGEETSGSKFIGCPLRDESNAKGERRRRTTVKDGALKHENLRIKML